jgi:curved DNA-binding protein CbpA
MTQTPTYYEVLGLPKILQDEPVIATQTLRGAYKRALLKNHPDKNSSDTQGSKSSTYSIDQIAEAFATLSKPALRAEYDRSLRLQNKDSDNKEVFQTGVETLDLDDLMEDEVEGVWYRSCRCGDERGFMIAEGDLEEASDSGEISVGCRGCSLWIKVLFGVVEE